MRAEKKSTLSQTFQLELEAKSSACWPGNIYIYIICLYLRQFDLPLHIRRLPLLTLSSLSHSIKELFFNITPKLILLIVMLI